jgi:hypothetical protein
MADETRLYTPICIAASKDGHRLFRNNVGTGLQYVDRAPKGWEPPPFLKPFTYGLPNGSADLVGWTSVTITPEMVGQTVAVFASVEVKPEGWRSTPSFEHSDRGLAQAAWARAVAGAGGRAGRARSVEEALGILRGSVVSE